MWQTYRKLNSIESHQRWTQKKWGCKPDKDLIGKNVIFYSIDTAVIEITGRWGWDWGKERQTFQVSLIPHCQHTGTLKIFIALFELENRNLSSPPTPFNIYLHSSTPQQFCLDNVTSLFKGIVHLHIKCRMLFKTCRTFKFSLWNIFFI